MRYLLSEKEYKELVPKKQLSDEKLKVAKLIELFRDHLCYKKVADDTKNKYFICDNCPLGWEAGHENGTDICPVQEEVSE
jgi:hypothetical protein